MIAVGTSLPEMGSHIGAEGIDYLPLPALLRAIDAPEGGFCTGCLTGHYPVPVQLGLDKPALERVSALRSCSVPPSVPPAVSVG